MSAVLRKKEALPTWFARPSLKNSLQSTSKCAKASRAVTKLSKECFGFLVSDQ